MKWFKSVFLVSVFSLSLGLTGCAPNYYRASNEGVDESLHALQSIDQQAHQHEPPVLIKEGYYVDSSPVPLRQDPAWLHETVTVRAQGMPLSSLMNRLLSGHAMSVSYDGSVNSQHPVTMDYHGSLRGALQVLANTVDYHYQLQDDHEISWSAFEDRTFDISFMPGVSNYLVGESLDRKSHNNSNSNSFSKNSTVLDDQQYNNLSAKLSLWKDLSEALLQLKSPEGKVVVSESTTSVMVHDRPRQVAAIARYIRKMNQELSKEVLIKVKVLEVHLYHDFNFGVDWNMVSKGLGTNFSLTGSLGTAANVVRDSMVLSSSTNAASLSVGTNNKALINCLSEQGRVRVVTEPQVVTMNNQMGTIRITKNTSYIQSVSQTQNETFNTTSVTPGSVTDGFTLYVLPKIKGNKIYLQVSSTIAHLDKLEKMSTDPGSSSDTSSYQAIQLPTISQKSFNQRSFVKSGSTLIMAGFKRVEDETKDASLFGIKDLGGKGAVSENVETLVLLTPMIVENPKSHVHLSEK